MVENEQPTLPIFESENTDSNADVARRIGQAASERTDRPWQDRRSRAAMEQSGIPEDLEANPIPPELAFLSREELHDFQITLPESVIQKPLGGIKKLVQLAENRRIQAASDYNEAFEKNPDSEETVRADKRLKHWNEHYNNLMTYSRIETAVRGDGI